jgi:aminoglycoside phosphotransferase (APT) family kinase protein
MTREQTIRGSTAADVLESYFGKRPTQIKRLHGGLVNHVFEGTVGREKLVVRLSEDPAKLQVFIKEQWAVRKARAAGVPAPEVLEVGNRAVPYPYMVAVKIRGVDATRWADRLEVARSMGKMAAKINSIRTSGFGSVFDWSKDNASRNRSWRQFLDDEIKVDERIDVLASQRMLDPTGLRKLRAQVRILKQWKGRPALTHGDLRFKNVVLDKKGGIQAILDWENCTSNRAPHWELSIALHDLTIDQKQAFLDGYGTSLREFSKIAEAIKTLNILNYANTVERAVRKKNKGRLELLRARLHGVFDLHSL